MPDSHIRLPNGVCMCAILCVLLFHAADKKNDDTTEQAAIKLDDSEEFPPMKS